MKHASEEIRKLVIEACKKGIITQKKASEITGYSIVTIWRWCSKEQYVPKPKGHMTPAFNEKEKEELKEFVAINKDATLDEIREHFGKKCSIATIYNTLKRIGLRYKKKSLHVDERDDEEVVKQREKFKEEILKIDPYKLHFLDETASRTDMTRLYGRSYKGDRCVDSVPGSWETVTLMASFNFDGHIEPVVFNGALNRKTFEKCFEKFILPTLKNGDTFVLDNLSSHKSEYVIKLCEEKCVIVIFLPPYSPDLNPIEKLWSKVKQLLRGIKARTREALEEAIVKTIDAVTVADIRGWYREAGYVA